MTVLLDKLNDDELDFTVCFTDTDGVKGVYDFLDIIHYQSKEYIIVAPKDADGYVDIFEVISDSGEEKYRREENDEILDRVFEMFRIKNEDEFDFF